MINYPFVRCLYPKKIINPYTNEFMTVPCGHCRACVLSKSSRLSLQCDLESQTHKYVLFVTLTYANRFIPRAQLVDCTSSIGSYSLIVPDTGEVLHDSLALSEVERDILLKKFHLFGYVPYLRKSDLQKFLKRFRYYVSKSSSEKVRYFACGEYGPEHFRPHYHILFFFDDDSTFQVANDAVLQSWPFGRVDAQLSRGKTSSYVASYVNSSCTIPEIFKVRTTRPFCIHSQKLGQGFLQSKRSEVYATPFDEFIRRGVVSNAGYTEFNLWRSCYAYYYPKCRGFVDRNACEIYRAYTIYDSARRSFPDCETVSDLAKEIALILHDFGITGVDALSDSHLANVLSYFYDYDSCKYDLESNLFDRYVSRIYSELLLSKHFLTFVCSHDTLFERKRCIKMIQEFYNKLDYLRLTDFFESQCRYYESDLCGDEVTINKDNQEYIVWFYDNVNWSTEELKQCEMYKTFHSDTIDRFRKRIKHKIQNDKNKIFFDKKDNELFNF